MFTESRRVLKFAIASVLLAVGIPTFARPAQAATPAAKIPTSIVWRLGPNGCGVKPLCSTFVGLVADASGRVIDSSLTSPPYPESVTTVIKPGFSKVSASYAGNATYAPSSATQEVRIPQPSGQIVGGTTEGDGPLQVRVSLTDPETGAPSGGYVTLSSAIGQPETKLVAGSAVFLVSGLKAGPQSVSLRAANPEYSQMYAFGGLNFEILPGSITTTSAPTTTQPSTTTTLPPRALVLTLLATAPLIASPSGPYEGPWGKYLSVRPSGEVGGGSSGSEGDFDVLCGGTTPPIVIDNGAVDPLDRPVCVARGFGVQTVVVRDKLGRFATRNLQWIASKPVTVRAVAGQPVTFTLKGQPADLRPAFDFPRGTECVGKTCTIPGNLVTLPASGQQALFNWTDINQNPYRFGTVILDVVPAATTTTTAPATKIAWVTVPRGCGVKFPCTGYEGIVADAAGKLISDSLTYPPAVKTVTTAIKPGFSKVSASYAGNATYAPSSGTRDIRIPQAAIQIVSGTTEGNAPLVVRVSLTDPETGAVSLIALTGAVIANSSPQGAGAGASPVFVNGVATVSLNGLKAGNYIVSIEVSDVVGFGVSTNFTTPVRISPAGVTTTTSSPSTTAPATTSTPPTTIVPTTTTIASGTRIATSIVWFVLNRCSPKAPCLTYVAGVADARGNLIANELSGGVQTVETSIKPGFLKFSATYAGNAVYSPSSGTREVRIPNAAIQIVTGTVEGSGPLEVLVSLTDPETGQLTRAEVTVAIAEASPVGPGPELFASTRYIAGEDLFKFPGLKAGTYIVSVKVLDTVGSVLFSKILVAARITAPGVTTTTPATTTTAPVTTTPPTTTPGNSTKSISSPANNSVVVGTAAKLQINDASNVARVDWFLNGISIGSDVTPADPLTWNAQGWGSGPFTLKAVVVDRSWKQTTTGTVSFSIR